MFLLEIRLENWQASDYNQMLANTQNVMETRLAQLHEFEAAEFENDIEIFILAPVFELQL